MAALGQRARLPLHCPASARRPRASSPAAASCPAIRSRTSTNAQIFSPPYLFKGPPPGDTAAPPDRPIRVPKFIVGTAEPRRASPKVSLCPTRRRSPMRSIRTSGSYPLTLLAVLGGNLEVDSPGEPKTLHRPATTCCSSSIRSAFPPFLTMVRLPCHQRGSSSRRARRARSTRDVRPSPRRICPGRRRLMTPASPALQRDASTTRWVHAVSCEPHRASRPG